MMIPPEFLVLSAALYRELPSERRWTKSRRDRWLAAMQAAVDLHFEVTENHDPAPSSKIEGPE